MGRRFVAGVDSKLGCDNSPILLKSMERDMGAEVVLTREDTGGRIARGFDAVNSALEGAGIWVAPLPLEDAPQNIRLAGSRPHRAPA